MTVSIHSLAESELEAAEAVLRSAFGWTTSRLFDLKLYYRLQPDGWIMARLDGKPAGAVGATIYDTYAYVGMMGVHRDFQRRGVGLALMQSLLDRLDRRQVPLVVLDASPSGQPMYEKLGFVPYDETVIFQRPAAPSIGGNHAEVQRVRRNDLADLCAFDAQIFGADRGRVLRLLWETFPTRMFLLKNEQHQISGYLCAQRERLGPWVSLSPQGAQALLQAALALPFEGAVSVIVPGTNPDAIEVLQRHGFERTRTNRHMGRGSACPPSRRETIYGQASLSIG